MLGLTDFWVAAAIVLSIATTIICLLYGISAMRKTPNESGEKMTIGKETIRWARDEKELENEI